MLNKLNREFLHKYPDPYKYTFVAERVLWSLIVLSNEFNLERQRISQISKFLTDVVGIETSPQAVNYALKSLPRGYVNRSNKEYKIMAKGKNQITPLHGNKTNLLINPGEEFSSKIFLTRKFLSRSTSIFEDLRSLYKY